MNREEKIQKIKEIQTAWTDHINFAEWIVIEKNPEVIVDLGVDYGYSTFSFGIPNVGKIFGIDSFEGDDHTSIRDTKKFVDEKKKELGMDNITFIKGYFDDIASIWGRDIDILHIDGFHTYEAVKNDYETWSKFVKDDGVILFHDTMVFDRNFGVYKLLKEIDLPKTNFKTSWGLGVVSKNQELIDKIKIIFNEVIDPQYA